MAAHFKEAQGTDGVALLLFRLIETEQLHQEAVNEGGEDFGLFGLRGHLDALGVPHAELTPAVQMQGVGLQP